MIVTISQKFKNSPQKQSPKQFKRNQSYQTPSKNGHQQTAQKTLMKDIIQKISESKRNSSNNKNIKRFKTKSQIIQKDIKQNQNDEMNDEKCIIISNQSANNPGFYQYLDWMKLHAKFLAYVDRRYMDELWKILRLINYGEVQIPTGLVYQIFIQIRKRQDSFGFQKIIDNFLQQNQTSDSYKSFKDVKNYLPITQIEKQYKCIRQEPKVEQKAIRQRCKSSKNVFERNFEVAKVRTIKKISSVCKNLVQEAKQMYQKPKISIYKNQSHNSLIKPERICHHAQRHKYKSQQQRYLQYLQQNNPIEKLFKAKQVDKSLFEGGIDHIPGVLSHLSRNKYCQAEKLRCKRLQQRPQYSKKKIY